MFKFGVGCLYLGFRMLWEVEIQKVNSSDHINTILAYRDTSACSENVGNLLFLEKSSRFQA